MCALARQQVASDDGALDFAGAFVDGDDAGIAVHAFHVGFAGIALAAVDLDGFVDNAVDHFAGVEFGAGSGGTHAGSGVFEERGIVGEDAGGFKFGVHIGEHPLDGLKFADTFAEGFATAGVFGGFVESTLREAQGLSGDADAAVIERAECDLQALAFFAEAVLCRN